MIDVGGAPTRFYPAVKAMLSFLNQFSN
jgi:flagellar biosynthesis chaperone FliJ